MKVLVIGGTGWVGHNIVLAFGEAGHDVTVFTRGRKSTFSSFVAKYKQIVGDKTDPATLEKTLLEGKYDVVIDSVPSPAVIRTLSEKRDLYGRYIHCGSTGVYTPLLYLPADEKHPFARKTYEGFEGKISSDRAALELSEQGKLRLTILRPCCIAGTGNLPLDNLGGRRKDFLSDIQNGRTLDLPGEGNALLQIVHIRDLARAFVLAAEKSESVGEVFNICGEKAVTLAQYCRLNAEALNLDVKLNTLPFEEMISKYGEEIRGGLTFLVEHMCFSIEKAQRVLGYTPQYSLEEAIAETVQYALQKNG